MPSETQLRTYTIREGLLDEWVAKWRAQVVPLRREFGFAIGGAWLDRRRSEFVWALSYDGEETFEERDRRYLASPEWAALKLDTERFVVARDARVVEEEDERFRTAPEVRHSARALLLDGDDLVLFKRIVPGKPLYWITPGGGVEPGDADLDAALRRELFEELGAVVGKALPVYAVHQLETRVTRVHHFFVCRLEEMDVSRRTGAEFDDPARGVHEVDRVPFTPEGIASIQLIPEELTDYLKTGIPAIRRLLHLLT